MGVVDYCTFCNKAAIDIVEGQLVCEDHIGWLLKDPTIDDEDITLSNHDKLKFVLDFCAKDTK